MMLNLNKMINYIDIKKLSFTSLLYTLLMKSILLFKGIKAGKKIKFYGMAKFKKSGNGKFVIGNGCTFRSKATSNLIGINRPCILISLGKESKLAIGNNSGFSGTVVGCFKEISIGNNVLCGANTLITDSDWHPSDPRSGEPKPVIISDNVWLGVNVTVLKGVTIGKNSVIGAGSVVTKNIPPNVIAAGNPCRVIKNIKNENSNTN